MTCGLYKNLDTMASDGGDWWMLLSRENPSNMHHCYIHKKAMSGILYVIQLNWLMNWKREPSNQVAYKVAG
jgi:hypothetical protein